MTNILYHRPTNREEAVVEGSINGVSATSTSDENVERSSEAVTETMDDGSEARAALLSVIRTNCFACAVSDDDDEEEEKEVLVGKEIQQSNLGSSSTGVSGWVRRGEKAKKKEVLDLGDISSTKPNWWQTILGASWSGSVSDVQKKDIFFDSSETNSRLCPRPNPRLMSNPPNHLNGELVAAGWPSWLCAVAGEAIYGWTPRRADTFENLNKDLTNRVDNLWYLSPEILLGATACGVGVDLWSTGCILAELLYGKAIMPGRIQVDQLHKIFELCGFSSDEFWEKSNLPQATVFKPRYPYIRCIEIRFKHFPPSSLPLIQTFLAIDPVERGTATSALRSEFFKTQPYACDPPSLPKYPPKQKMGTSEKKNEKKIDAILLDRELEKIINGESLVHHGLIDKKGFLVLRTDILRTRDAISTWGVRIIDAS